jgi:polar amino acid transport system substrate-binding protein
MRRRPAEAWVAIAIAISVSACGLPHDVEDTLGRVEGGGTLRVGVTEHEPYVVLDRARPAGVEVRLLEDFAGRLRARVRYMRGSEEELVEQLREGALDVVIGGITKRTPWKKEVAPTRPYATTHERVADKSVTDHHVMLTRNGENAFLVRLERYLLNRRDQIRRMLAREGAD